MKNTQIILSIAILFLAGCGHPYSAKKGNITDLFERRQKNITDSDELSQQTQQFLRLKNLTKEYKNDRIEVIEQVYDQILETQDLQSVRALAEMCVQEGRKQARRNSKTATALYLTAAEGAYRYLMANNLLTVQAALDPTYRFVADMYNTSVTELIELYQKNNREWKSEGTYEIGDTVYNFSFAKASIKVWNPNTFDQLIPAYEIKTKGLRNKYYTAGLGAPFTGVVNDPSHSMEWGEFYAGQKAAYPVSVMLVFKHSQIQGSKRYVDVKIVFFNALTQNLIDLEEKTIPLEVDYSTPLVIQMKNINPLALGFFSMFNSDKKISSAGLYLLEPYNPDKIPVVMVHGLMSSPVTWIQIFNDLRGQPEIRNRYQFWFFSYPTGLPILYSSSILRQDLLDIQKRLDPEKKNPNFNNMVLVGHSMGGLLSRLMMQDSGDGYWNDMFVLPLDELQIDQSTHELLQQMFFFESIPFIQRVIFISTPHRGSPLADKWYSSVGSGMIELPNNLVDSAQTLFSNKKLLNQKIYKNTKKIRYRSINNLSPASPFIIEYNILPVRPDVIYHSIIGTRKSDVGPGSSDGVVPYESSHIDFSASERLVHSGHPAQENPDAIDEVKRILLLHLQENGIIKD